MSDVLAVADRVGRLFLWLAVLWVLIVVLGAAFWYYRRRWLRDVADASSQPWTLADLRALRSRGDITEEEYHKLRSAVLGRYGVGGGEDPSKDNSVGRSDSSEAGF